MNADEVKKILIELVNASFDCGAFPDEDMLKSDDYQKLTDKSRQLTDTIANLIESHQAKLKLSRNGNWIDKFGACVCCDGEIPHGHSEDCDFYKLQQKVESQQKKIIEWKRKFSAAHKLFRVQEKEIEELRKDKERLEHAMPYFGNAAKTLNDLSTFLNDRIETQRLLQTVAERLNEFRDRQDIDAAMQETKPKEVK